MYAQRVAAERGERPLVGTPLRFRRDNAALRSETAALLERMEKLEAASAAVGTASDEAAA